MSTRIRLRRMGANKRPFYRVVVADQRSPRNGRFIENIGRYHPMDDPSLIEIDRERALHWLRVGAQPSSQVRTLLDRAGIWEVFVAERPSAAVAPKPGRAERPAKQKVSKKAAAKSAAPPAPEAPPAAVTPPAAETPASEEAPSEVTEEATEVAPAGEASEAPASDEATKTADDGTEDA